MYSRSSAIDSQNNAAGDVYFQVTTPSVFNLDGLFGLTGSGRISADIKISDLTVSGGAAGFIYHSLQRSLETVDQVFIVGGRG